MFILKNKKGSQLVEKILMTAFSIAAGGAVITYGVGVINASKTTEVSLDGTVATNSKGLNFTNGHRYRFASPIPRSEIADSEDGDMEYFSISRIFDPNGNEVLLSNMGDSSLNGKSWTGYIGYNCYCIDWEQIPSPFYLSKVDCDTACLSFDFTNAIYKEITGHDYYSTPVTNGDFPRLNQNGFALSFNSKYSFEFSGEYVRAGNGVHLLDLLEEVE